jgi:hypothetical protein
MADWAFYPVKFVGEQTLSLTRFPKSPFPHPFPSCGCLSRPRFDALHLVRRRSGESATPRFFLLRETVVIVFPHDLARLGISHF